MYAFSIQTVAVSQLHKQLAETKDIEMARKANVQNHQGILEILMQIGDTTVLNLFDLQDIVGFHCF